MPVRAGRFDDHARLGQEADTGPAQDFLLNESKGLLAEDRTLVKVDRGVELVVADPLHRVLAQRVFRPADGLILAVIQQRDR